MGGHARRRSREGQGRPASRRPASAGVCLSDTRAREDARRTRAGEEVPSAYAHLWPLEAGGEREPHDQSR